MIKCFGVALMLSLSGPAVSQTPALQLWRLDCGSIDIDNLGDYSDTGLFSGQKETFVASCYLIRNGDRYLLWDTGLDGSMAGKPKDAEGGLLKERIGTQLARIGVKPEAISFVGLSHYHFDHTGQAADFPAATLLIGKGDWEVVKQRDDLRPRFTPWIEEKAKVESVAGDKDVFGDGKVTMLAMPGHTPGHHALLVRLASGPVLLSGDQYHFTENRRVGGVPGFNRDRADTLASHDRFEKLAVNIKAKVIIQHEQADVAKLPAFPNAAE